VIALAVTRWKLAANKILEEKKKYKIANVKEKKRRKRNKTKNVNITTFTFSARRFAGASVSSVDSLERALFFVCCYNARMSLNSLENINKSQTTSSPELKQYLPAFSKLAE
jgi:hypothetical protein